MTDQPAVALVLAAVSFVLTVIWGAPLIRLLRWFKMGDTIRLELRDTHIEKQGTPTMGGVMFVMPALLLTIIINAVTLLSPQRSGRSVLLPVSVMLAFGFLGAIDDWEKLRNVAQSEGISPRFKFMLQFGITAAIAYALYAILDVPHLFIPGPIGEVNLGWLYIPIAMFIILSTTNAINFTDGMDGLAGLISATTFAAFGIIALLQGQTFLARFCFTLVGALFGFLWYNVHPAQMIMGDTGSMPLGATLGVVALMTGQWLLIPIIAVIPVSEALSVVLQISYFKLTKRSSGQGKRIFKMAPIHYHFELSGWSESQVVQRFWLISLLAAIIGIALAVA